MLPTNPCRRWSSNSSGGSAAGFLPESRGQFQVFLPQWLSDYCACPLPVFSAPCHWWLWSMEFTAAFKPARDRISNTGWLAIGCEVHWRVNHSPYLPRMIPWATAKGLWNSRSDPSLSLRATCLKHKKLRNVSYSLKQKSHLFAFTGDGILYFQIELWLYCKKVI